jgi:hypothetical protein
MHLSSSFLRHPALWTAGAALSSLPTGIAAGLLDGTTRSRALKALGMAGFDQTAERLLLHHLSTPPKGAAFEGLVLIAGLPRIGKSTLARRVATALHMRAFSTDELDSLYTSLPRKKAVAARRHLLSKICRKARGLVLEGKGLVPMLDAMSDPGTADFTLDPDRLRNGEIQIYAVGCCDSSAESWTAALRAHGGWVAERGEDYMQKFANGRYESNQRLRAKAHAAAIPYFEIPRENFTAAIDRTVAAIVAELPQGAMH